MAGPYPPQYGAGPVGPPRAVSRPAASVSGESRCAVGLSGHAAAADSVSEAQPMACCPRCAGGHRGRCRGRGRDRFRGALRRRRFDRREADDGLGPDSDPGLPGRAAATAMSRRSPATRCAGCSTPSRNAKSDLALADLSSDAFRKQFEQGRGDIRRQDGVLVALSGAGAVHHARDSRGKPHPAATGGGGAGRGSATRPGQRDPGVFLPAACRGPVLSQPAQLNESPHAHDPVALGLSMVKPCFSMVSTKSIVAPWT